MIFNTDMLIKETKHVKERAIRLILEHKDEIIGKVITVYSDDYIITDCTDSSFECDAERSDTHEKYTYYASYDEVYVEELLELLISIGKP